MVTVEYPEIGSVLYKRNTRAKKINISIKPYKGIIVSYPPYVSRAAAEKVVFKNAHWIRKNLQKIEQEELRLQISEEMVWRSLYRTHRLGKNKDGLFEIRISRDEVIYSFPDHLSTSHPEVKNFLSNSLENSLRREAKTYLPPRITELSMARGIKFSKLSITKAKTRWGSCSSVNNINLSLYLMLLPKELIDYVILHELAHVKYKHHGKSYWAHLESICSGSKEMDVQIRNASLQLVIP